MQRKYGRRLLAGVLGIQDNTTDYNVERKNNESAPESAAVHYNQDEYQSDYQINALGIE